MGKKWQELSREEVFKKYSRSIERVEYKLPSGELTDFYVKVEGPAVAIVAFTKQDTVLLVRQYRPGPGDMLTEIPGGYIDKGELPEQAAARELKEETGYIGKLEFVTSCLDDAYSTMCRYIFVATSCINLKEAKMSATESPELLQLSVPEFRELLRSGKMTDVEVGYLALDYLGRL